MQGAVLRVLPKDTLTGGAGDLATAAPTQRNRSLVTVDDDSNSILNFILHMAPVVFHTTAGEQYSWWPCWDVQPIACSPSPNGLLFNCESWKPSRWWKDADIGPSCFADAFLNQQSHSVLTRLKTLHILWLLHMLHASWTVLIWTGSSGSSN